MSDQHENADDESLPSPTPQETARLMREGSLSNAPCWKRLLPPWAFSIGLHLFVLPFVLVVTVTFADQLFVPTVWSEVRDEKLGNDPYSLIIEDRDFPVEQVQEKLGKPGTNRPPLEIPPGPGIPSDVAGIKPPDTQVAPVPPYLMPVATPDGPAIQGTVVAVQANQITVALEGGAQLIVQTDENTQVIRGADPRFLDFPNRISAIPVKAEVLIVVSVTNGKYLARAVAVRQGPIAPPKQPQTGSDGNIVIEQPASSVPGGDKGPDVIYVPTPLKIVDRMLTLPKVQPNEVVFDLGSGDGRIPITAAKKFGAWGFGYEIDAKLVKEAQQNLESTSRGGTLQWSSARIQGTYGLDGKVVFERRDIFKLDLSKADVVTLYLLPSLNVKLIPQLEKMKPGSRIVSHDFDMKGIKPDHEEELDATDDNGNQRTHKIYMWTVPLKKVKPMPESPPPAPRPG